MKYRKLTLTETKELFARFGVSLDTKNQKNRELKEIKDYIKKYYPSNATSVLVSYNSEYNDSDYDLSVQYVAVYDENQNELLPVKGKEKEARSQWSNIFYARNENEYGHSKPLEDKVYILDDRAFPELYVLEN